MKNYTGRPGPWSAKRTGTALLLAMMFVVLFVLLMILERRSSLDEDPLDRLGDNVTPRVSQVSTSGVDKDGVDWLRGASQLGRLESGSSALRDKSMVPPERETSAPVVVAAGDIAVCYDRGAKATARLLDNIEGTVLTLGDNAYKKGSADEFADCYDPTWGRHKDRTKPSSGNHDYATEGAKGYFSYFGKAAGEPGEGYYSYDRGSWHIVALNSNLCLETDGCHAHSRQARWLENDLSRNRAACTLAYWHHPLFSSGIKHGNTPEVRPLWKILYKADADVVLSGHEHNYERFAPQSPEGKADPERGIREFVVGTGGKSHYPIVAPTANSEIHNDDTYGVLKLTLRPEGYDWQFVPVEGARFTDSGSGRCH